MPPRRFHGGGPLSPHMTRRVRTALLLLAALPRRAASLSFYEACYLRSGSSATSFSSTFDADLLRFATPDGFLAYASLPPLSTTVAFFDPVLAHPDDPAAADALLSAFLRAHPRAVFLHCGASSAALLAEKGFYINPYGVESRVRLPISLDGARMRGVRREVLAARRHGVCVRLVAEGEREVWRALAPVERSWRESRALRREVRRATRRAVLAAERHTTKLVASVGGNPVGWACLDHIYERGELVGVGLAVVRADPRVPGVATLLAADGAAICAEAFPRLRFLDLGLSPLAPVPEGMEWNPLLVCGEEACVDAPPRAPFVDGLFRALFRWGTRLYNTPGLAAWKRKWRPDEGLAYVAVKTALPLRELVAVLLLLMF